jgi:hypothetical protein
VKDSDKLWILSVAALVCAVVNEAAGKGKQMWFWLGLAVILKIGSTIKD